MFCFTGFCIYVSAIDGAGTISAESDERAVVAFLAASFRSVKWQVWTSRDSIRTSLDSIRSCQDSRIRTSMDKSGQHMDKSGQH